MTFTYNFSSFSLSVYVKHRFYGCMCIVFILHILSKAKLSQISSVCVCMFFFKKGQFLYIFKHTIMGYEIVWVDIRPSSSLTSFLKVLIMDMPFVEAVCIKKDGWFKVKCYSCKLFPFHKQLCKKMRDQKWSLTLIHSNSIHYYATRTTFFSWNKYF